ncbi:LysR family transcriptional regulator [Roseovarius indicus]|uniref:LysR family transcriptional regulator n=1 Tax=Roseovarius indicus TaxID=540747 RepID=UPI0032EF9161
MNWAAISFDWNQIRAFWATAEEGSFSAAARALGQTQPTLGRQVAALEEDLGVTLFERAGRSLLPTKAGLDLLEHCREMGAAAQRISLTASGASQAVEGQVRITATDIMCLHVLPPAVAQIRRVAPGIEVDLVAANDIRDLLRREADIAVRHVRPEQADLTARLVQEATARPYAATRYLEARGRPASPADMAVHDFVSFGNVEEMIAFLAPMGIPITAANMRVGSESGVVAWELVRQGFGIAIMADDVAQGVPGLEPLLPQVEPIRFPVWLVTHRELHTSKRIRLVYDLLAEFFTGLGRDER